jgi:alkanesulfonate monooxygenase SsuD/methylene tetrahydromethanopterin reductase-like flavin-dependent oxidoreductase (luciferase family)
MRNVLAGLDVSTSSAEGADPVAGALRAEALGFDFVSCSDHPSGSHPTFETWTMLTYIAARTSRVAVMPRVLSVPFRWPAVVAKMAESLDRLSGGRLILGMGAGAFPEEFRAFGLPGRSAGERVAGLADAVRIARGLWEKPGFSYEGPIYRVHEAPFEPRAARPVPIWLGTFGDHALEVTGELADGWIPSLGYAPAERLPEMRGKVLEAAERAGREAGEIRCVLNLEARIEDRVDPDPGRVVGPSGAVAERLAGFVEQGFDAFNFIVPGPRPPEQLEAIAGLLAELRR